MTVFEILKFNREIIERLREDHISLDDTRYINLFDDYLSLVGSGHKVSYAVAILSDRYKVSIRKIYSIIKHFQNDCTIHTR